MLLGIIKQFNWVDIYIVILLFRIGYIAQKNGLAVEFFKFLGTLVAIYLALHYYTLFSDWLGYHAPVAKEKLPLEFLDFLSFMILVLVGYFIFVLLRKGFCRFISVEAVPQLDKWAGLILGMGRGILLVGLVVFILVISSIDYLKDSAGNSYLSRRFFRVAPATYSWLWNKVGAKFMPGEKFNNTISEVQADFLQ